MIEEKSVFAVICARGGSKRLPDKNIRELAGKPLIAWTIEAAKASKFIDRVILSSDDEAAIEVARQFGCEAPFIRPAELATDDATTEPVLLHALQEAGAGHDFAVMLQPTSPLRCAGDIDQCILRCVESGASSIVTFTEVEKSPYIMFTENDAGIMRPLFEHEFYCGSRRRQDLPTVFRPNGAVYVTRTDKFLETKDFYAPDVVSYKMPPERSVDIDTEEDFQAAERLMSRRR